MASGPSSGQPTTTIPQLDFYPAYCNKASPTYFTWVKLTASDIHHVLRSRPGFGSHNNIVYQRQQSRYHTSLLFYLNHPVQFVYVAGVVAAFDDHEYFWVFTVDDSSGATIDVTCRKPENVKEQNDGKSAQYNDNAELAQAATVESSEKLDDSSVDEAIALVEVLSRIEIGSVVKVKGTISNFRSVRQIALERLEITADTNAEVRFWAQRTKLFADVLSKPWILPVQEQKRMLKAAQGEVEENKGRAARRMERSAKVRKREKRHADQIVKAYEIEERGRERVAEERRQDGLRLRVESDRREQERIVERAKKEKSAQSSTDECRNRRVADLRDLVR